jgi:DNA-binding response OmpR family regulator
MGDRTDRTLLVIENNLHVCDLIYKTFEAEGFKVVIALDSENAIEKAKEIDPELIFISFDLPKSNGLKITRSIRTIERLKEIPVILLVSHPDDVDERYAEFLGIVDILVKPFKSIEELVSRTLKILNKDVTSSEMGELSRASFVEKAPVAPQEAAERTEERRTKGTLTKQSGKDTSESKADYAPHESERDLHEKGQEIVSDTKKVFNKKLFFYAIVLILAVAGFITLFLMSSGQEFMSRFFGKLSSQQETVQQEATTEMAMIKDQAKKAEEAIEIPPSKEVDTAEKAAPPLQSKIKTETVSEKPSAVSNSEISIKPTFSVHIGAFLIKSNADAMADKLKKKGYDVFIRKVLRKDNKTIHRVLIGRFNTKNEAIKQSDSIRQKEGVKSFVYQN